MARRAIVLAAVILCLTSQLGCDRSQKNSAANGNTPSDKAAVPSAQTTAIPEVSTPPPTPTPVPPPPITIPKGTELTVSLLTSVGSKTSHEGDRFRASLSQPIVVDDNVVVPKGSRVSGVVTQAHAAGRFKGGANLTIVLDTLELRGHPYAIHATPSAQSSKGKGKRTAGMIGGGTAGGALIGGLAGGGKGAAIGALVGAGTGTAGAGFTGKRDIVLPVETPLGFKLLKPITLEN